MWKRFFGCLCLFLPIEYLGADQERLTFCNVADRIFSQKCTESFTKATIEINDEEFRINFSIWRNDATQQEMISQFFGLLKPKNASVDSCLIEAKRNRIRNLIHNEYFTARLFQVCELIVHSLVINTNKTTELPHLYTEILKVPYITELFWTMHHKCHPLNEIISNLKHLQKLELKLYSSVHLNECDFQFDGATQLKFLHIYAHFDRYFKIEKFTNYAFTKSSNLYRMILPNFQLSHPLTNFEINIPKEMLQGLNNLEELTLFGCFFKNISTEHFQDLTNLRELILMETTIGNFDWLRYVVFIYTYLFIAYDFMFVQLNKIIFKLFIK